MNQKHPQQNKQFLFYLYITESDVGDHGEYRKRCLGTSKPEKTSKISMFSYQSATVGLSIVNQPYHAHDRALHCGRVLSTAL